jgi:hypothetical protein
MGWTLVCAAGMTLSVLRVPFDVRFLHAGTMRGVARAIIAL